MSSSSAKPAAHGSSTGRAHAAIVAADPLWAQMRREAEAAMSGEPALTGFVFATVINHATLEEAVAHRVAQRLNHADVDAGLIVQTFQDVLASQPDVAAAIRADLSAVFDRDPACTRYLEPVLFFKGFHALVTHRFAHELWRQGRKDFAGYQPASARASCWTTRQASLSVRPPWSATTAPSCMR
jgi:serine O-acetyltransferase